MLIQFSCANNPPLINGQARCNGKKILVFENLQDLQNTYNNLKNSYDAIDDDAEQALVDFENEKDFYSLRKKQSDMDEGIIPDDTNFDAFNFSVDDIFQTLLNEDGMIVIDSELYLWDQGCVLFHLPFNCINQTMLQKFSMAIRNNDLVNASKIKDLCKIKTLNSCADPRYDFESIVEELSGRTPIIKKETIIEKSGLGCGNKVYLNTEIVNCDLDNYYIKVTVENISSTNISDILYTYNLTANTNDPSFFNDIGVQIYSANGVANVNLIVVNQNNYASAGIPFYPTALSDYFVLKIPVSSNNFNINVESISNPLSGNSCLSTDSKLFDPLCPWSIKTTIVSQDNTYTIYRFDIAASPNCSLPNGAISWSFGDGTPDVTTTGTPYTVTHSYLTPCIPKEFNISAYIKDLETSCPNSLESEVEIGDHCKRTFHKFDVSKGSIDGKKFRLVSTLKERPLMLNGSKIKHIFKWRKDGTKTISNFGPIFKQNPNNSGCIEMNIADLISSESLNKKRKLKVKYISNSILQIDVTEPYSVKFTHTNSSFTPNTLNSSQICAE